MYLPHKHVTHLTVFMIDPFLKLSARSVTIVLVFYNSSSDLDLGMKLVSSALCIIVVVKARVAIIVELTNLWKSKKTDCKIIKLITHFCGGIKFSFTNRIIVEARALVIIHPGGLIKDKPSLSHGLFGSGSQHVSY